MSAAFSHRIASSLLAILVASAAGGCSDDPLAPSLVAGTYVLQSVNGVALPAPAGFSGPADEPVTVVADTLRLNADGSGSRVRVEEYPTAGDDPSLVTHESELTFTTTEDEIAISFTCPPNALALCAAGPHIVARLGGTGLLATQVIGSEPIHFTYSEVQRLD